MSELAPYDEAVKSGQYQKADRLSGKYDNVRLYWEDEVISKFLQPYLELILTRKEGDSEKISILDLGCGSGDGYGLLMSISRGNCSLAENEIGILSPDSLDLYTGIDLNPSLIEQAKSIYGENEKIKFIEGDFNQLLSDPKDSASYDLYFASYGTLSHNTDEQTIDLLSNIARKSKDGSFIVCDWLGRYSYEWQNLWTQNLAENKFLDYVISYIYSGEKMNLTSFPLRLLCRKEVLNICERASKKAGVKIKLRELFDRSIFVGRHMDTAQYNPHCQPMRATINSLFEPGIRTNLERLFINYIPKEGFPELNKFYKDLSLYWNNLVSYTIELLSGNDLRKEKLKSIPEANYPGPLKKAMQVMKKAIEGKSELNGDPRADIIEPQLSYALRALEMELQQGMGCGHGIVAIFEVIK